MGSITTPRRRAPGALAAAATILTAAAACAGDEADPGASTPAAEAGSDETVITISDFTYSVPESVEPGATITVRNEDGVGHTVTSDDGHFDVEVPAGQEVGLTVPDEPGEFPFHCRPHPQMTATLVVG